MAHSNKNSGEKEKLLMKNINCLRQIPFLSQGEKAGINLSLLD